jgi:hypothetical protein
VSENDWSYAITAVPMARIPQTELDALRAEVDRLRGLCGRAAAQDGHSIRCWERGEECKCDWSGILTELREASK